MNIIPNPAPATGQPRPQGAATQSAAAAAWRPQACGLTREELRRIVLAAIG
jgi:hypothetical protein